MSSRDRRRVVVGGIVAALLVNAACSGGDPKDTLGGLPERSSPLLARPLPARVAVAGKPSMDLADPAFEPLPGATAHFGVLGAAAYRIEIPDDWNGVLVMWTHGFGNLQPSARVDAPDFRRHLIGQGIAWAASSFSSTSMIPSVAADETAALWDHFVASFGRPRWSYVTGLSMGGWATQIAAERYADRYDGALALCGAVGTEPALSIAVDVVVASAYVAGLTQQELDAAVDPLGLLETRVRPLLDRLDTREDILDLLVAMTGGSRRFDREGLAQELATNWERARLLIASGLAPPRRGEIELVGATRAEATRFNQAAVAFETDIAGYTSFTTGMEVTGRLRMPLLTVHTTGDGQVPINQAVLLHQRVAAADGLGHLVQRVIEDAGHCGFTTGEQEAAFDDLRAWVERGVRPAGTQLGKGGLDDLDRTFELKARSIDPAEAIGVAGDATLDGEPFDAEFAGAVVIDDGLVTPCQAGLAEVVDGAVEISVLTAEAAAGCARAGSTISIWIYRGDEQLFSEPIEVRSLQDVRGAALTFRSDRPRASVPSTSDLHGEVYDASGERVSTGRIEAHVGDELCGIASIRGNGSFNGYILSILQDTPRCPGGAPVTFSVDGIRAGPTIANVSPGRDAVDLTIGG